MFDEWPDISPDGTRIAFGRVFDNTPGTARSSIFIVNLDGSGLTQITDPELNAIRPRWSSDGKLVAFSSNADNFAVEGANVWVVAPDGTDLRQVTHESGAGQAYFPDWSPDGEHIVSLHHRARSSTVDLAVIGLDGMSQCTLWQGTSALSAGDADWGEPGGR